MSVSQRNAACKRTVKFVIESLVFQNRLLNAAHSIWDIKISWYDQKNFMSQEA